MTEDGLQEALFPEPVRVCPGCRTERRVRDFHKGTLYCRFCMRFGDALRKSVPVDRLLADQGGVCAICRRKKSLHIDHIHYQPADRDGFAYVRGLLCARCNMLVGGADDDPDLLEASAAYLRKEPRRIYLKVVKPKRRHRKRL